jgi:hypothetical protein
MQRVTVSIAKVMLHNKHPHKKKMAELEEAVSRVHTRRLAAIAKKQKTLQHEISPDHSGGSGYFHVFTSIAANTDVDTFANGPTCLPYLVAVQSLGKRWVP